MTPIENYENLLHGERLLVPHCHPGLFIMFDDPARKIRYVGYGFRRDPVPCTGRNSGYSRYGRYLRFPRYLNTHRLSAMLQEMVRSDIFRHEGGIARGYSVRTENDDINRPLRPHTCWKRQRKTQWK